MNVLITGASTGLGRCLAQMSAQRGHNLALCASRLEDLEALRTNLLWWYPTIKITVLALDMTNREQVFQVFRMFHHEMGDIGRVIVNAGIGLGKPIETGHLITNTHMANTHFSGAQAQCEAAMEIFRGQGHGHLVSISSMRALSRHRKSEVIYDANNAGLAAILEALRLECRGTKICITTLFSGYVQNDIGQAGHHLPYQVSMEKGCRSMMRVIERKVETAYLPRWPWAVLAPLLKCVPDALLPKL